MREFRSQDPSGCTLGCWPGMGVGGLLLFPPCSSDLQLRFSPVSFAFANTRHALLCSQSFHFPSESGGRPTPASCSYLATIRWVGCLLSRTVWVRSDWADAQLERQTRCLQLQGQEIKGSFNVPFSSSLEKGSWKVLSPVLPLARP